MFIILDCYDRGLEVYLILKNLRLGNGEKKPERV